MTRFQAVVALLPMDRRLLILPAALALAAGILDGAEAPGPESTLTLEQCLVAARETHPDLVAWRARAAASEAQLEQARARWYPRADLLASGGHATLDKAFHLASDGTPSTRLGAGSSYSAALAIEVTVLDFGRTASRVRSSEAAAAAARLDVDTAALGLDFAVKDVYYGVLKAQRTAETIAASAARYEEHLAQAKAFFAAGSKPRYDVTRAGVELSAERLRLSAARNDVKVAWVRLANLIGEDAGERQLIDDQPAPAALSPSPDAACDAAFAGRPDLRALQAAEKSAEHALQATRREYYPKVVASGSYDLDGASFPVDRGWQAGLDLELNLFAKEKPSAVREAEAGLAIARAVVESARRTIRAEVEESVLNLWQAEAAIADARVQVELARENLELAELRYASGVGSPIEVTDAMVVMSRAELSHIGARYDFRVARAALARAMGSSE
ncbi:MAG: TolC family protein [Acidobacteriota bacterium]